MSETAKGVRPDLRIFVNAYYEDDDDPTKGVKYTLTQNPNDPKIRVTLDNLIWAEKHEEFVIWFDLCNYTDFDLEYMDNPIYINDGDSQCPPPELPGGPTLPEGFAILGRTRKRLKLANPEPQAQARRYRYRLRIKDKITGDRHDLDPIIQNGNGAPFTKGPGLLGPLLVGFAGGGLAFVAAHAAGLLNFLH